MKEDSYNGFFSWMQMYETIPYLYLSIDNSRNFSRYIYKKYPDIFLGYNFSSTSRYLFKIISKFLL